MSCGVPMGPMDPLDRPVAVGAGLGGLGWPGWPIAAQIVIYRERTSRAASYSICANTGKIILSSSLG